jgi:hypothetical protein
MNVGLSKRLAYVFIYGHEKVMFLFLLRIIIRTSGCPWPKATLFFSSYFLLPCPTPTLPLPCPCPCPISNFPFAARDRMRKLHRERAVFFFPLAARDRRRKLHRERAMFFSPLAARDRRRKLHRERAMFFFPFAAKDRRRKLHLALQDRQTKRRKTTFIYLYLFLKSPHENIHGGNA